MNRKAFIYKAGLVSAGIFLSVDKLFARQDTDQQHALWLELISYARWCPSPHNVQPWKVKILSKTEAHLYYDPARVPGVVDDQTSFTIVSMAMFIECLNIAARPIGYKVIANHEDEPQLATGGKDYKLFARLFLQPLEQADKISVDRELIKSRRTSRLHYDGGIIPTDIINGFQTLAATHGHRFVSTSDQQMIDGIIHMNTDTVMERANDEPTMNEMRKWIRTTETEAAQKKDGLWSRTNATSGRMMHNFFFHHQRFNHGWKKKETCKLLNKSMKGTRHMAWIKGPFEQRDHWVKSGIMLQQLWLEMTRQGIYMHPLGTVITTPSAKSSFLKTIGEDEKEGTVWFLVRMGYSRQPARSFRLAQEDIIIG